MRNVNPVYDKVKPFLWLVDKGFAEDKSLRERKCYYYVSSKGDYHDSCVNINLTENEFISLKKLTMEHLNYMINNKFILPHHRTYAESLTTYMEIKSYLENKSK